jgi:hypothetical protein
MRARERGNVWPVVSVIAVAVAVLILPVMIRHRQASARMATIDAQVTIGDTKTDLDSNRESAMYRWPDSEVPRTAERLRDVTAVAIAASTYVAQGAMSGHVPSDAGEIATGIAKRQLIPGDWLTNQQGVLKAQYGTIHLRYAPSILTVEVVSMPATRSDGPALFIRIPDDDNTTVGPRYFESMNVDRIIYTSPFAPIAEVVSAGWRERLFKQSSLLK